MTGLALFRAHRARRAHDRRLDAAVNEVIPHIPVPWSMERFVGAIAQMRGRPITLMAHPLAPDAASGWWLKTANTDYIIYSADCHSVERREAVVAHELAHLLLGHEPAGATSGEAALSPAIAARFMNRTAYSDRLELEAETLGTMILAACHAIEPGEGETGARFSHRLR